MKYIALLPDITLKSLNGQPVMNAKNEEIVVTHEDFILGRLNGKHFGATMAGVLQAVKIQAAVGAATGVVLKVVALEDADYKPLAEEVRNPSSPATAYDPRFAPSLAPFMKATADAADEPPETPADEETPAADEEVLPPPVDAAGANGSEARPEA